MQVSTYQTGENFHYPDLAADWTLIEHDFYSLAYDEKVEQARWVTYTLDRSHLEGRRVSRTDFYSADPSVATGSAHYEDYRGTGWSRGHLVPAADRAFSDEAMAETFLMSNISPQSPAFNGGIWRELEEHVRDWARSKGKLIVVCGPVFKERPTRIGRNAVGVPDFFYKVVLNVSSNAWQAVGFYLPNEASNQPLSDYMFPVDSIEHWVEIDFFQELMTEDLEVKVEGTLNEDQWIMDPAKYRQRTEVWNKRY